MENLVLLQLIYSVNRNILQINAKVLETIGSNTGISAELRVLLIELFTRQGNINRQIISFIRRPSSGAYLRNFLEATATSFKHFLTIRYKLKGEQLTQAIYIEKLDLFWRNTYHKVKNELSQIGQTETQFLIDTLLSTLSGIDEYKYPLYVYPVVNFQ
jgi:hypothetical protein